MLIISENELIHTDDFNDVIEHFGVKGMKWGSGRVISDRSARRAKKKLAKLERRTKNNFGNLFKDAGVSMLLGSTPDRIRYNNNLSKDKQKAKIMSNKQNISYKDAKKQMRDKTWAKSDSAKADYKSNKKEFGRSDLRTKSAKANYKSEKAAAKAKDIKRLYGDWATSGSTGSKLYKLNKKSKYQKELANSYRKGAN